MKKRIPLTLESGLFLIFSVANLFPLFFLTYIPSLDGPSHLYNSTLIRELWFPTGTVIPEYLQFNPGFFTNWTGHFILAVFNSFLPFPLAEKLLYALLLLGLPYSFRYFILRQQPDQRLLIWLIFPLCWSMFVFYGFYNFILGIIFFLLFAGIWVSRIEKRKKSTLIVLLLLGTLCAASHIFCLAMLLLYCLGYELWSMFFSEDHSSVVNVQQRFRKGWRRAGALLLLLLPGIIITVLSFYEGSLGAQVTFISPEKVFFKIRKLDPLIGLIREEEMFTAKFGYLLFMITAIILVLRFYRVKKNKKRETLHPPERWILRSDLYFVGYIMVIAGVFIAGIWFESGKYLSERILFAALIFLITWICLQKLPVWLAGTIAGLSIVLASGLMMIRVPVMNQQQARIQEFSTLAEKIKPGTVVFTVNDSGNWFYYHFPAYLGAEKPIVLLDNYECDQRYFPLLWKADKQNRNLYLESFYPEIPITDPQGKKYFDVIVTMGGSETSEPASRAEFQQYLRRHYRLAAVSSSGFLHLYEPM